MRESIVAGNYKPKIHRIRGLDSFSTEIDLSFGRINLL